MNAFICSGCEPAFVSNADLFSLEPKVDFGSSGVEEREKPGGRLRKRKTDDGIAVSRQKQLLEPPAPDSCTLLRFQFAAPGPSPHPWSVQDGDKPRRGPALTAQLLQQFVLWHSQRRLEGREFVSAGQNGGTAMAH